jgi:hypothetical protein
MTKQTTNDGKPIVLVPDSKVWDELGKTRQSIVRWDADPAMAALGWPPPITIRGRKHRPRHLLETFKANLIARALKERATKQREQAKPRHEQQA